MGSNTSQVPGLTRGQMLLTASMAGAAVLCFLPWVEITFSGELGAAFEAMARGSHAQMQTTANGFQFTEGIIAFIACIAGAGAFPALATGAPFMSRGRAPLTAFAASALAALCMLVLMGRSSSSVQTGMGISGGLTIGFYAALCFAAGATVLAYRQCRALQGT